MLFAKLVPSSLPSNMTQTVYYVRHGLSEGNVAGVASGAEHDCDLTDEGRQQAARAGKELQDKNIDLIVCSPMKRTVETATIIAEQLGYDPARIVRRDEFIERYMGYYSQRPHTEYREAVQSGALHDSLESTESMVDRVTKGLDWVKEQPAQHIVIVSHGGTGRAIKAVQQNLHHSEIYKMDGFGNTEVYEFTT